VAVAAVRGTELAVAQEKDQPSQVGVFDEGHVAVTSPGAGGRELVVGPGQETEIRKGQRPSEARPLQVLLKHRDRISFVRQRREIIRQNWVRRSREERRARRQVLKAKPVGRTPVQKSSLGAGRKSNGQLRRTGEGRPVVRRRPSLDQRKNRRDAAAQGKKTRRRREPVKIPKKD
jgi:hypothetical protein